MRQSFTAVLERHSIYSQPFATEPYEAGWASEARWFVRLISVGGAETTLKITP